VLSVQVSHTIVFPCFIAIPLLKQGKQSCETVCCTRFRFLDDRLIHVLSMTYLTDGMLRFLVCSGPPSHPQSYCRVDTAECLADFPTMVHTTKSVHPYLKRVPCAGRTDSEGYYQAWSIGRSNRATHPQAGRCISHGQGPQRSCQCTECSLPCSLIPGGVLRCQITSACPVILDLSVCYEHAVPVPSCVLLVSYKVL
jgi:hypothetical protein